MRTLTKVRILAGGILIFLIAIALLSYITNPFVQKSVIQDPFVVKEVNGELVLEKQFDLKARNSGTYKFFSYAKSGYHILNNVYVGGKKAKSEKDNEIISEIVSLRFDEDNSFIISGDHFSVFYPRSLGVFYYPALDSRTVIDEHDWMQRQKVILKSTAYALEAFSEAGTLSTTIVPTGRKSVTLINVYSYPSDTLYSIFHSLKAMKDPQYFSHYYSDELSNLYTLKTKRAAELLLTEYQQDLKVLLQDYLDHVYDYEAEMVRADIHLSGTKDITMRKGSFYDNVMLWKTLLLADELGIANYSDEKLEELKQRIIKTFWYEKGGYFLEDQSIAGLENNYYSSDWLVVLFTGFLNPENEQERKYYEQSVAYIQQEKIDEPFGLRYHQENRAGRQFPVVRVLLPSYGGSAIWSFWGTEYIKLLAILYNETGKKEYMDEAKFQLQAYRDNIINYRGFPEVYNNNGKMLRNLFYKSVRQTGWVVNYLQAKEMVEQPVH